MSNDSSNYVELINKIISDEIPFWMERSIQAKQQNIELSQYSIEMIEKWRTFDKLQKISKDTLKDQLVVSIVTPRKRQRATDVGG